MNRAWEKLYHKPRVLPPNPGIAAAVEFLSAGQAKRILDLGCGMGRHTVYLASLGFDVYGLDSSPKALGHTLAMLSEKGLAAHLAFYDMKRLPYDDGYFDAIISIQVIHHNTLDHIRETVGEVSRVLKNHGLIWITVPARRNEPSRRQKEIEPGTFLPLDGIEKDVPHHYFAEEEIPALFASFSVLDLHIDGGAYFSMVAKKVLP